MEANVSRRDFLVGSGLAAGLAAAGAAAPATATEAEPDQAAGHLYRVISDELNPQDYDYRQNSGDLSHVLSPWKMGNLEFSNRIVKSAAGSNYENGGWDKFVEYYRRLAAGGTEMIWVENFAHIFTPYKNVINANIDEFADEDIIALTDAIHAEGAKCGTQTDMMGSAFMGEITARLGGVYDCTAFTLEDLDYMVNCYVEAAKTFKRWGFDAWELNCAGNNMTQWFFSKSRNHRDDEYGAQTYENRTRFISRVIDAVHAELPDFPIQVLMNGVEENDANMGDNCEFNTVEDGVEMAKMLEAAGVASLHVRLGPIEQHATQFLGDLFFDTPGCAGATSFGTQFDFDRHFQGKLRGNHDGCGIMLDVAGEYKAALSIPVGTVTYLDPAHAPDYTEQAVAEGKVDFLMINRPLTVDNDYVNKLKEGRFDEIRPCTRCCHCWNDSFREDPCLLSSHFGSSNYACRLDPVRDQVGQDRGLPGGFDPDPAETPKKVMVVGAGPAGMEAARIAAQRGHEVTLYEKSGMLGGLLNFASAIKGPHQNLQDYIAWSARDLELKGVTVVTGQAVDADFVRSQAPDAVIVATGGVRNALQLQATQGTSIVNIDDIAAAQIGDEVTIVGGNCQATDIAVWLMAQGKKINIVMDEDIELLCKGQSIWCRKFTIPAIYARGVRVWPYASISAVGDGTVSISRESGCDLTWKCDTLVVALDDKAEAPLAEQIAGDVADVRVVGAAGDPWNIQYAIRSGNWAGRLV